MLEDGYLPAVSAVKRSGRDPELPDRQFSQVNLFGPDGPLGSFGFVLTLKQPCVHADAARLRAALGSGNVATEIIPGDPAAGINLKVSPAVR